MGAGRTTAVMDYRRFGSTGVKVSPICLGSAFRGRPADDVCKATIAQAIDLGVNFIDVANIYQEGHSERLVGEVLKGQRDQFVLTTKVGSSMGTGPNDIGLSRVHILREVEHSLRRLQTDHIDIYLVHQPDPTTPHEETLRALDDLVHQGKVRYIGCCNYAAWQVCAALWTSDRAGLTPFIGVQNHYNLLRPVARTRLTPLLPPPGAGSDDLQPAGRRPAFRSLPARYPTAAGHSLGARTLRIHRRDDAGSRPGSSNPGASRAGARQDPGTGGYRLDLVPSRDQRSDDRSGSAGARHGDGRRGDLGTGPGGPDSTRFRIRLGAQRHPRRVTAAPLRCSQPPPPTQTAAKEHCS